MALETGNYLNDLNETYPTATDTVSEGDGHLQLIKKVLKQSFAGVDRVSEYIYVHTSAPTVDVGKGRLWLDTSTTPNLLKIYDGSNFKKLPISATIDYKLMGNDTVGWVLPTADGTANYPLTTTGSNVLAFAQIATAAIADNAVDGAKIAMGSDAAGDVLYHNGTDYVRLAKPGTPAGEVLTFATSASAPSWVAPSLVDVTHSIETSSSYMRSDTYITTGFTIAHTKISATSTLFVQMDALVSPTCNFENVDTAIGHMRLADYDSGSTPKAIIANTTDNIQMCFVDDVGEGTGVAWEVGYGISRMWRVATGDCPGGTTGASTFEVFAKFNDARDGGLTFANGTMMVWEVEE